MSTPDTSAPPRLGLVIIAMTIGNAVILVSQTAVPLSLPAIMDEFGVGSSSVQWVLTASLLPLAGLMVLGGRLGDLYGLRRVFCAGSIVFAIASLAAGLAPTFEFLVAARVVQGAGGALLLPTSVAIVSAVAGEKDAGRALGTLGGAAAVAGALGPIIGGALTGMFGWRFVMLVNLPLAALSMVIALLVVPSDPRRADRERVDVIGAVLLSVTLIGVVFGIGQSQVWGWTSPGVWLPLVAAVISATAFVAVERRVAVPLMDLRLLTRHRNYAGATISQGLGGMIEMGLGVIFPLLLILNLGMDPATAGLALLPTTLPMVIVAPLAGRWYDKVGGRLPLMTGFGVLGLAGVALMLAVPTHEFVPLIPGLTLYGIGLAIVLTVNDPVSLDSVPTQHHGQVSGVSATAEQFGGALGIAAFYLVFHTTYVHELHERIDSSDLPNLTTAQYEKLRADIEAAEQTGLRSDHFDPEFTDYLRSTLDAATSAHVLTFGMTVVVAVLGVVASALLVRRAVDNPIDMTSPEKVFAAGAVVGSASSSKHLHRQRHRDDQPAPRDPV
ncbi:MFS transporter [Gordonia sp. NPDC058843]|uniref:MFS transporter n=1 Tax=Gordonia sp. NPDC058843 TaxID=3346648 RepID=UPI00369973C5